LPEGNQASDVVAYAHRQRAAVEALRGGRRRAMVQAQQIDVVARERRIEILRRECERISIGAEQHMDSEMVDEPPRRYPSAACTKVARRSGNRTAAGLAT
jgi:hypothetical protein